MSESPTNSLSIEQLTEAVTSGVLRSLAAHQAANDGVFDLASLVKSGGLYGSVAIVCGMFPNGQTFPGVGGVLIGGPAGQQSPGS